MRSLVHDLFKINAKKPSHKEKTSHRKTFHRVESQTNVDPNPKQMSTQAKKNQRKTNQKPVKNLRKSHQLQQNQKK